MRSTVVFTAILPALLVGVVAAALDGRREQRSIDHYLSEIRAAGTVDNRRRNIAMQNLKLLLSTLDAKHVSLVEDRVDSEPFLDARVILLRGFGSINVPEAAEAVGRRLLELTKLPMVGATRAETYAGFLALQEMTVPRAFEVLYEMIPKLDSSTRPFALAAVAGKREVFQSLDRIAVALESAQPSVRAAAGLALRDTTGALGQETHAEVAAMLEKRIPGETDPVAIQAFIVALASHRQPSSVPVLEQVLLNNTLPRTRERTVESLIVIGGEEVGRVLERHAERETDARTRAKAAEGAMDILERDN